MLPAAAAAKAAPAPIVVGGDGEEVGSVGERGRGIALDVMLRAFPSEQEPPARVRFFEDDGSSSIGRLTVFDKERTKHAYRQCRATVVQMPYAVTATDAVTVNADLFPIGRSALSVGNAAGHCVGSVDFLVQAYSAAGAEPRGGVDVKLTRAKGGRPKFLSNHANKVQQWMRKLRRILQSSTDPAGVKDVDFFDFVIFFEVGSSCSVLRVDRASVQAWDPDAVNAATLPAGMRWISPGQCLITNIQAVAAPGPPPVPVFPGAAHAGPAAVAAAAGAEAAAKAANMQHLVSTKVMATDLSNGAARPIAVPMTNDNVCILAGKPYSPHQRNAVLALIDGAKKFIGTADRNKRRATYVEWDEIVAKFPRLF